MFANIGNLPSNLISSEKKLTFTVSESQSVGSTGIPRFTLLMWGHIKKLQKAKTEKIEVTY